MDYSNRFSVETREIIGGSRDIALELGYHYISSAHILLSDCIYNKQNSVKDFCFKEIEEFEKFYNSQRIGNSVLLSDVVNASLPLTKEAEKTIRLCLIELKKFPEEKVQPFHLFLAAASHYSIFSSLLPPEEDLYDRLFDFYKQGGHIPKKLPKQTLSKKILTFWKRIMNMD